MKNFLKVLFWVIVSNLIPIVFGISGVIMKNETFESGYKFGWVIYCGAVLFAAFVVLCFWILEKIEDI